MTLWCPSLMRQQGVDLVRVIASGCETLFEVLEELGADEVGALAVGFTVGREGSFEGNGRSIFERLFWELRYLLAMRFSCEGRSS